MFVKKNIKTIKMPKTYAITYRDKMTGEEGRYTGKFYSGKQARGYFDKVVSKGIYNIIGVRETKEY